MSLIIFIISIVCGKKLIATIVWESSMLHLTFSTAKFDDFNRIATHTREIVADTFTFLN